MTRVNLVPPSELSNQHLMAEWRELPRVPKQCWLAIERDGIDGVLQRNPPQYVLGKGHVRWAYNKGAFLLRRFESLTAELLQRGYRIDTSMELDEWGVFDLDERLRQEYEPTVEALALSRARIAERIAARPGFYRFRIGYSGTTLRLDGHPPRWPFLV